MSCLLLASPASATYQRKIHQKNSKGIELIFVVRNMPLRTISKRILGMQKSRTNNISPLNVQRYKKKLIEICFANLSKAWLPSLALSDKKDTQTSVSLLADLGEDCPGLPLVCFMSPFHRFLFL